MSQEINIYTETMAKVYADQGHWEKAAEIYQHLVQRDPERQALRDALAQAQRERDENPGQGPEKLVPLFREWIGLLLQHEKLQKLKKLRDKL